jgi:hypothetical protein
LFSPQISPKSLSHSQNKETGLKQKRKRKVLKKRERNKRAPKVSHEKGMNIFREEKNNSTSNLLL